MIKLFRVRNSVLAVAAWAWVGGGCSSTALPPDDEPVSFADHVQPVLSSRCISCHQPGGIAFGEGISMDLRAGSAYDAIVDQPSDQDASLTLVIPGDAENSLLFQKVNSSSPPVGVRMPRFQFPLSAAQIDLIRRWIDEGALDN